MQIQGGERMFSTPKTLIFFERKLWDFFDVQLEAEMRVCLDEKVAFIFDF